MAYSLMKAIQQMKLYARNNIIPKYKQCIDNYINDYRQKNIKNLYITIRIKEGGFIIEEIDNYKTTDILRYITECIMNYIELKIKYYNYSSHNKKDMEKMFNDELVDYFQIDVEPVEKYYI